MLAIYASLLLKIFCHPKISRVVHPSEDGRSPAPGNSLLDDGVPCFGIRSQDARVPFLHRGPRVHNIPASRKARGPRDILAAATLEAERRMPGLPGDSLLGEVRRPLCFPWLPCPGLGMPRCVLDRDGFGQGLVGVEAEWIRPLCPRSCWGSWGHTPLLQVPLGVRLSNLCNLSL